MRAFCHFQQISNCHLQFFGISETFLTENIQNSNLNINGIVFERKDRPYKLSGELLVYIADHIDFKRRNDIEIEDLESIWLQITFPNNKPILLNFVYRPPSSNQIWIEKYEQQLISAESTNLDYSLLGDYNSSFNYANIHAISPMMYFFDIQRIFLEQKPEIPRIILEHEAIFCG